MRQLKTKLPAGFQVKKLDLHLTRQLTTDKKNSFASHHGMNFHTPEDFIERGFGYCIMHQGNIVCVASTFTVL